MHYRAFACIWSASTPLSWEYKEIRCDRHLSGERSERRTKGTSEAKEGRGRRGCTGERDGSSSVVEIAGGEGCHLRFPSANFHTLLSVCPTPTLHPFSILFPYSRPHPRFTREYSRPPFTGHPLAGCPQRSRGRSEETAEKRPKVDASRGRCRL